MANNDELIPKNPNEIVVPIGQANLITTQEEVDKALKTASHIFREQEEAQTMDMNTLAKEVDAKIEIDSDGNETIRTKGEQTEKALDLILEDNVELVTLSAEELAALPAAKFGRDNFGRALNKGGTPRKKRNDKGVKRGAYAPRTAKNNTPDETPTPAPIAVAAENVTSNNDNIF